VSANMTAGAVEHHLGRRTDYATGEKDLSMPATVAVGCLRVEDDIDERF
jgi:hypothetical protein